ncbi:MAG: 3-phosphoshikimate 1-carboxyvinyltransferase [Thermodesulfobacteriota bacterium]|nr:3-phosphoshikimate 1-carboxyvinyltransferase [Thermodesulfobacteriota bacterium]
MQTQSITASQGLRGEITVPGDKSISHRSIMFGSLAQGKTHVCGFLQGEDNLSTLNAFQAMGVSIDQHENGELTIHGCGLHGLQEPDDVLDCGNSGTTIRLMSGLLAGQEFFSVLTGDQYLRKRPMGRVVNPLAQMGAQIWGREQGQCAPLAIHGQRLSAIDYTSPVASAQVKSAIMLAGLYADGVTTVNEPHLSRDHSERMLRHFGVDVISFSGGASIAGGQGLIARDLTVPGDISSAAFFMVAALVVPGSELLIRNVGINPSRSGIIDILQAMNGSLELLEMREMAGEPVADVLVKSSDLRGIDIGGELIPRAIDELPVVSIAAACAAGTTRIRDAHELRVKETDRIAAMAEVLQVLGVQVKIHEDGMTIDGCEQLSGGRVNSCGDHRIAMSSAIAALRANRSVTIDDTLCTATSFPNFWELIEQLRH